MEDTLKDQVEWKRAHLVGEPNPTSGVEEKYAPLFDAVNKKGDLLFSREDEFVYFLCPNPQDGSLLIEEKPECIVLWNFDLRYISAHEVLTLCIENLGQSFIVPFVEDEETLAVITSLGGKKIDFTDENYDGAENFGSYLLSARN